MEGIDIIICKYIRDNWIKEIANRAFATEHDIDEKTVRQIKNIEKKHYSIKIETLEKICIARNLKLEEFFALIKR